MSYGPPTLRNYQHDAVAAVLKEFESHDSTMVVMATGLGKTVTFCEVIRRMQPRRAIVVAHRQELITQACGALERAGMATEIEMADRKADASMFQGSSVIVAMVQSLISGKKDSKRMEKFRPQDFGLLVIDEFHHGVAASYRSIIDHFRQNTALKVLGVTATPDRFDAKALGQICESVAFKYDIAEAIEDGWLVPIEQQFVRIKSLDISHVRTTAGDLNGADLAKVWEDEKNLQGMVGASISVIGNRKAIAFTSSVRHAEMCCDIFNRHRAGMAAWISGDTPEDDRRKILTQFKASEVQVLANVGIATEGFDCPDVEVVIMGRATKSRSLYTQMVGRGTRAASGVIDGLNSAFERREAIAESRKPSMLVLDFVGNSGKHKLVTTADILGGKYDDETMAEAVKEAEESGQPVRMDKALGDAKQKIIERIEQAKLEEARRKAKLVARVEFVSRHISPFDAFQITPKQDSKWDKGRPLSEKQRAVLLKLGVNPDETNYAACKQVLYEYFRRKEEGLCTLAQAKVLLRAGYDPKKLKFEEASLLIDDLKKNNWQRTDQLISV